MVSMSSTETFSLPVGRALWRKEWLGERQGGPPPWLGNTEEPLWTSHLTCLTLSSFAFRGERYFSCAHPSTHLSIHSSTLITFFTEGERRMLRALKAFCFETQSSSPWSASFGSSKALITGWRESNEKVSSIPRNWNYFLWRKRAPRIPTWRN